jgi:hypothetical protein
MQISMGNPDALTEGLGGLLSPTMTPYSVAVENVASRRIAEKLNGKIVGTRRNPKYESVVYEICPLTRPWSGR